MTDIDPLVLFMPSGKRGRLPVGTPVLEAARHCDWEVCDNKVAKGETLQLYIQTCSMTV